MITESTIANLETWCSKKRRTLQTAQISMAKRNNVDMAIHIAREPDKC
jgi:glutaryl-CoA dehydrogenase